MLNRIFSMSVISIGLSVVVFCISTVANGQQNQEENVIRIGPDRGAQNESSRRPVRQQAMIVSQYWIGIEGGEAPPALRSHLRLNEDQGLLINRVMPDSPADEGELKVYDVVTRVNGKPVRTISQLSEHVGEQGERKGRLAVEIIREGRPNTVWVTPSERPAPEAQPFPNRGGFFEGGDFGNFQRQQRVMNGASIIIQQSDNGPPKISVQRGNERWEIESDDPEALAALPEDLRDQVEGMLQGRNDANRFGEEIQRLREHMFENPLQPKLMLPRNEPDPDSQSEPSEIELPAG